MLFLLSYNLIAIKFLLIGVTDNLISLFLILNAHSMYLRIIGDKIETMKLFKIRNRFERKKNKHKEMNKIVNLNSI